MEVDVWLPIRLGLTCFGLATIITRFVPETLTKTEILPEGSSEETSSDGVSGTCMDCKPSGLLDVARSEISKLSQAMAWVTKRHYHIMALLITLLLTTFGRFAQELLSQYVTKRYEWSWSQVSITMPFSISLCYSQCNI